jgi:hypothetical protein
MFLRMASPIRKIPGRSFQNLQATGFLTKVLDQPAIGDLVKPRAWIIRQRLLRPGCERGQERRLDRVLHEFDMPHTHSAREHGHQPAVLVPEEVLDKQRRFQGPANSRTSMLDPGIPNPGLSRATSSARS